MTFQLLTFLSLQGNILSYFREVNGKYKFVFFFSFFLFPSSSLSFVRFQDTWHHWLLEGHKYAQGFTGKKVRVANSIGPEYS